MDLSVHNTVLRDIWSNMLIKFSEKIRNSLAKIIIQRWIQDTAKYLRWSFFCKLFLSSEVNSESCQTSNIELYFYKNSQKRKDVHYFCKNFHLGCLTRFWICFWIGSKVTDVSFLNQFEYQRWQITYRKNLKNQKESASGTFRIVERNCC